MTTGFNPYDRDYASLSVKDLLDARDAYHVHLCHIEGVFATAIGRYLIQNEDPDAKKFVAASEVADRRGTRAPQEARTIANSSVKPWSWPCVLVFVEKWLTAGEIHARKGESVPPFLYLPDGRVAPACVVEARSADAIEKPVGDLRFSSQIIGGGYPVLTEVQGRSRVGSIGCLVTDGTRLFALTNHHVAGDPGQEVYTVIRGKRSRLGVASKLAIGKKAFSEVYQGFAGTNTMSTLDVGLVDVDDGAQWTANVFGLGALGPIMPFDASLVSLDWIGCHTVAHGAASGELAGEIKALFYRYRTVGGTDYVADFLIGGREGQRLPTCPGDSGTLWCVDRAMFPREDGVMPRHRPLAIQWGGQKLVAGGSPEYTQFALATAASIACRELDVDIVTDLRAELPEYWGAVGHYKIAQLAIEQVSAELRAFMQANLERLTYDDTTLSADTVVRDAKQFVPLADVPDIVWKTNVNRGDPAARAQENWCHYADIDLVGANGDTLSAMCGDNPTRIVLQDWIDFYKKAPPPKDARARSNNMGSLPFRVWQIYEAMATHRAAGKKAEFLCAAGVLAHYVGDACQPLHGSIHSDGLDGATTGVHSTYEEKMIDVYTPELRQLVDALDPKSLDGEVGTVDSGHAAAVAALELMRRCAKRLPPESICELYNQLGGGNSAPVLKKMWDQLQEPTVQCIANGARTLAAIWQAAYDSAGGGAFAGEIAEADLQALYESTDFLPSLHLANLDAADYPAPGAPREAARGGRATERRTVAAPRGSYDRRGTTHAPANGGHATPRLAGGAAGTKRGTTGKRRTHQ